MLARKVLDLADQQGLLEPKVIEELRQKLTETRFVVTPAAIAKVLVDHGHLTPFQARKLVGQALGPAPDEPPPPPRGVVTKRSEPEEDLTFQDDEGLAPLTAVEENEEEIVELEAVAPPPEAPKK